MERVRCTALNASGQQCKRLGKERCFQHTVIGHCSVCMEDIYTSSSRTLECTHTFHDRCLERWKTRARTCPVCRAPFDQPTFRVSINIQCIQNGNTATESYETHDVNELMENLGMSQEMIQRSTTSITDIIFEIEAGENAEEILRQFGLRHFRVPT